MRPLAKTIQLILAQQIVSDSDSTMIAEATFTVWQQLASQIDPVIGPYGTEALFNRAIHIISKDFPWLTIQNHRDDTSQLGNFKQFYELQEPGHAIKASEALLVAFIQLLVTLIGEPLTHQLLNPVLAISNPKKENS